MIHTKAGSVKIIILNVIVFIYIFLIIIYNQNVRNLSPAIFNIYSIESILISIYFLIKKKHITPSIVIILYTIVSQFGWIIVLSILNANNIPEFQFFLERKMGIYYEYLYKALFISMTAFILFIIGDLIFIPKKNNQIYLRNKSLSKNKVLYKLYLINIYLFGGLLVYYFLKGELSIDMSYGEVKSILSTKTMLNYSKYLFYISLVGFFILSSKEQLKKHIIVIGLITYLLLATGNRNDILYPLAIAVSARVLYYYIKSILIIFIAILVIVVISPIISLTRNSQDKNPISALVEIRYYDSLIEMGQQIFPTAIAMKKVKDNGYYKGLTYIMPTTAILSFNTIYSTDRFNDSEINVTNIIHEEGYRGLGFSMIAEIYLNFGLFGMIVIFPLLGYLSNKYENITNTNTFIIYSQIAIMFMILARNSMQYNIIIIIFIVLVQLAANIITEMKKYF